MLLGQSRGCIPSGEALTSCKDGQLRFSPLLRLTRRSTYF